MMNSNPYRAQVCIERICTSAHPRFTVQPESVDGARLPSPPTIVVVAVVTADRQVNDGVVPGGEGAPDPGEAAGME
jgi:hypothetical protein